MEEEKERRRPLAKIIIIILLSLLVFVIIISSIVIISNRSRPVEVYEKQKSITETKESFLIDQEETSPHTGLISPESTVDVEKEVLSMDIEEPEISEVVLIEDNLSKLVPTVIEAATVPEPEEPGTPAVAERIYSEQKLISDLIKDKPLIITFKIKVEYEKPVEVVQAEEPDLPVVENVEPDPPVIDINIPDGPTIVEYELKNGLIIEVESGPKHILNSDQIFKIDIEPDSKHALEEEIINPEGSPFIEIISPENWSFYKKKVQIEGRIANAVNDSESVSKIGTVTWEIEGLKEPEELVFGSDGIFFLSFSADSFSGILDILIKAEGSEDLIALKKLVLFDGNIQPELTLISPINESVYGAALRISGNVTDPSAVDLGLTGPASLEYSLFPVDNSSSDKQISGTIPVRSDGSFSKIIFSRDFSGEQLVTITVHGRNGRTLESSVSILEAKSDIPGFTVVQEDAAVMLYWNPLPDARTYNMYYTDAGIDPVDEDGNVFPIIESPVIIRNLREGYLHRFQLEAVSSENESEKTGSYWSEISEMILLMPDTLKPTVTPGYQQISLSWSNIPGTESFDILRSENNAAFYSIIEKGLNSTSYIDRDVVFGKSFSYQIRPSLEGSSGSSTVTAESLPFPEEKTAVIGEFRSSNLQDIEVAGSYIFLANGTSGIRVIDNDDPVRPLEVGRYPSEDTKDIIIRGERAYIADGFRGIKILDINDPGNPILLGSRKTIDATSLALIEDTVFIADGEAGIKIIDISSERRPSRTGTLKTDFAKDLVIRGSELFIADGPGGFKIVDISGSPNLELISTFNCEDAVAIDFNNGTAYIADSGFGVRIINVSDSANPIEIGNISINSISDILVSDNYLFVSNLAYGLQIYEISDPLHPVLFDNIKIDGASALTLNEGVIYLIDQDGFKTVKSFTTGLSFVIAEYQTDGNAYDLTYIDKTLYLSDHRNGVKIVDVSNPTDSSSFQITHELDTTYAESVVGYGSRLLIADGEGGLVLGDITYSEDGVQQIEISETVDLPGITKSLVVHGDTAYIAAREEGMHLLDLETREINSVFTGGSVQEIAVDDKFIYIADGIGGLKIYENKDVGKPELLSTVSLPSVSTVAIINNYVVAGGRDGLSVIDVSIPEDPAVISNYSAGWIEDIYLESGYIYAAAGNEGLFVLDMKKPKELVLVSSCKDVYAVGVEVEKDLAFVADVNGFKVVRILIPSWLQ